MVGAADLNNKFRALLKGILRNERYLETRDETIDMIIEAEAMFKFENDIKRVFRYNKPEKIYPVRIRGLRASDGDARIQNTYLELT